ncbi:kinetochore protein NDC80 homolog [Babylonia areolata]|uniref:kinetochore protein NDC80 homolog n=1 Tax=Babylonia areolata TaxID=304850 RepID=UPI003FD64050
MRKSSFGQFGGRLSSGPLRVKNDGGGPRKSTLGSHTPQNKRASGVSSYSSASSTRSRSMMSHGSGLGQRTNAPSMRTSGIGIGGGSMGMRGSGIGVRNRADVPKDPRPISDKGFQHKCVRTLIDFLTETKYPHPLSQKMLMSPPSKEFFRIFEYICCQLDPAFKLGPKMEEEVPRQLKLLGYPFNISRSSMHAVGTPHTWPTLLAALVWLIDLIKVTQRLGSSQVDHLIFPPEDEDFDSVPDDKIKFQYFTQCYEEYLRGADEFDLLDEELGKVLEDKYLGQSGGFEAIRSENSRLAEEIELLTQEMSRVDKLQEQQEIMLLDKRKFRDYLDEMENVSRKLQQMVQTAEEEHVSLDQELRSVVARNQQMQALYDQQDLTLADVERLRAARQELHRTEAELEREVEAIDSDIWKSEMGFARLLEQIDTSLGEYNRLARALRLIPSTTDLANGIDYELRSSDPDFVSKFEIIKPALIAMKMKGKEALQQAEDSKLRMENRLEQMNEQIADIRGEMAQLEKDIKSTDEELGSRKELYHRDLEHLQSTIDRLQQEIRDHQMSSQISQQDAEREVREARAWAQQTEADIRKTEQQFARFLHTVCTLVVDHKAHVQQQLEAMEKEVGQVLGQEKARWQRLQEASRQLRSDS